MMKNLPIINKNKKHPTKKKKEKRYKIEGPKSWQTNKQTNKTKQNIK